MPAANLWGGGFHGKAVDQLEKRMHAIHLPNTATPEEVEACLRENGYAIVDNLVTPELMDRIDAELHPYMETAPFGEDSILGKLTRRTGGLIARSPSARELIMNETVLGTAQRLLSHASTIRMHMTQIVALYPGSPAQKLHQDELVWDMFPFPMDYDVQCNTLWAMTDYTEEMGATRIIPGSHKAGKNLDFDIKDSIPAVMPKGSVLLYTGKVYHGSGHNRSDQVRRAVNLTYAVGWVRQEENQYLSCPPEIARTLPDDLLKLMGYQCGAFSLGYVNDFEDPMNVLREPAEKRQVGASYLVDTGLRSEKAAFLSGAEY